MKIILVIDDDADDRSLFMEAVEEITPELICHTAGNGQDGLKQMRDAAMGCPDLIFLDVNMPVMNGWDCLSALKKEPVFRDIPVIMYSTSSYHEDIARAVRNGALCFFTKPSNFNVLKHNLRLVAEHLEAGSLDKLVAESPDFAVV